MALLKEYTCAYGVRRKPVVLFFRSIHRGIKVVEILVPEQWVVNNIPLPARIVERVAVALAREVEPLRSTHEVRTGVEVAADIPRDDQTHCLRS